MPSLRRKIGHLLSSVRSGRRPSTSADVLPTLKRAPEEQALIDKIWRTGEVTPEAVLDRVIEHLLRTGPEASVFRSHDHPRDRRPIPRDLLLEWYGAGTDSFTYCGGMSLRRTARLGAGTGLVVYFGEPRRDPKPIAYATAMGFTEDLPYAHYRVPLPIEALMPFQERVPTEG